MLLHQLLFAATAASFLVVPEVSVHDGDDTITTLPIDASVDAFSLPPSALSQSVEVPCRRCKGRNTYLDMDFAVEGSKLTLNGFELYPNADPWHGDLTASVIKGNGHSRNQRLGYSLAVRPEGVDEQQHMEVIGVELRVIEVGNRFVEGIPSVKVKLVKTPTNEILIGSLEVNEPSSAKCHSMWCRAKGVFGGAFKGLKGFKGFRGCHKFHQGHGAPNKSDAPERSEHPIHGHHRQWRQLIKNMASHIFLPVLMGITAGFGVAIFVMFLCRLAIRLTSLIRGNHEPAILRCPRRHRVRVTEFVRDEEKAALMADQDLPSSEDADAKD